MESDEFYDDEPGPPKGEKAVEGEGKVKRPSYSVVVSHFLVCEGWWGGADVGGSGCLVLDGGTGDGGGGLVVWGWGR